MARDKVYIPGDWYVIDDVRGYKVRASQAQLQWDQLLTIPPSFSPRQPQDLVTGVRDDQSVPMARPRQPNQFTIVGTSVTAAAAAGDQTISVDSAVGFAAADLVQIMLDSGVPQTVTLTATAAGSLSFTPGLLGTVGGSLGSPIENSVINLTSVGGT